MGCDPRLRPEEPKNLKKKGKRRATTVRREGGESTNPTLPVIIVPKERLKRKLNLR